METIFELHCRIHGRIRDADGPDRTGEPASCPTIVGNACCGDPLFVVEVDRSDRWSCTADEDRVPVTSA